MNKIFNKYILPLLISIISIGIITFIIYKILTNLVVIGNYFKLNEYAIIYLKKVNELEFSLPLGLIVSYFFVYFIVLFFRSKFNKVILVIILFIVTVSSFVSISLLSTFGDYFVFQLIENIKNILRSI